MWGQALIGAAVLGLGGCGSCGYQPGSFRQDGQELAGERATVGCLDLAIEYVADPIAIGPVGHFQIANRCDHATVVDLGAVRATARFDDGSLRPMRPYDPSGVIVPKWLDGRRVAVEYLEYLPVTDSPGAPTGEVRPEQWASEAAAVVLCLDVSGIDARAVARGGAAPVMICMKTWAEKVGGDKPVEPTAGEVLDDPRDA